MLPASATRVLRKGILFSLASNAAVLLVLKFGQLMWPEGLPAHSQNVFWLASGVNAAGLLLLGLRYWPVILLDAFPAHWIAGEPLDLTTLASFANAMESLTAAWLILQLGAFDGRLDRLRSMGWLLIASLVAPLFNTVLIPAYFCLIGVIPWGEYGRAFSYWSFSNGTIILAGVPLILSLFHGRWTVRDQWKEALVFIPLAMVVCTFVFDALFSGQGMNFAFIVFPLVIYAAVRFGVPEVSVVLALVLLAIYLSIVRFAHVLPPAQLANTLWFTQAFYWVLAATGLVITVLVAERRRAEERTLLEQSRTLEASLREERARLDALRYQINPHFLFNSINSVCTEIPLGQPVAREMLIGLAEYLRSTLDRPDSDTLPLRDELTSVEHYLSLEKNRFGARLQLTIAVEPDARDINVPVFLLQPLVENAIRHGLEASKGSCELRILGSIEGTSLRLEVANSGQWKEAGTRQGLGLENIRRRLELLYGPAAHLTRTGDDGWVRFQIVLPIQGAARPHALSHR